MSYICPAQQVLLHDEKKKKRGRGGRSLLKCLLKFCSPLDRCDSVTVTLVIKIVP